MREVKFKVWDIDHEVYLPIDTYGIVTTEFKAFGVMLKDWDNYREGEYLYPNTQILQQFTGLKDKNGKEIYEGDIILVRDMNKDDKESYVTVEWFEDICQSGWSLTSIGWYRDELEVIGNIHENKELIKDNQNEH